MDKPITSAIRKLCEKLTGKTSKANSISKAINDITKNFDNNDKEYITANSTDDGKETVLKGKVTVKQDDENIYHLIFNEDGTVHYLKEYISSDTDDWH